MTEFATYIIIIERNSQEWWIEKFNVYKVAKNFENIFKFLISNLIYLQGSTGFSAIILIYLSFQFVFINSYCVVVSTFDIIIYGICY